MSAKYEKSNNNELQSINLKKKKKTNHIYSIKINTCFILLKIRKKIIINSIKFSQEF